MDAPAQRLSGLNVALLPSLQELINRRIKAHPEELYVHSKEEELQAPSGPWTFDF